MPQPLILLSRQLPSAPNDSSRLRCDGGPFDTGTECIFLISASTLTLLQEAGSDIPVLQMQLWIQAVTFVACDVDD